MLVVCREHMCDVLNKMNITFFTIVTAFLFSSMIYLIRLDKDNNSLNFKNTFSLTYFY